ncbi:MAG: D-cysteine desulfhydrase family protein [Gammaproteobacteria bacterium]|nr:D-cysteine desulfhydrase family protein [Gammaproteobacteria bacterium]
MNYSQNALGILDELPRAALGHLPTPIEFLPNLTRHCGGAQLYIKRDDCTGLAFGGNKVRQLEFYLGDAQAKSADTILITGAVQSNFVRLAVAAARKLGMDAHVQLEDRVPGKNDIYHNSGNALLNNIMGATVYHYPEGEDEAGADAELHRIADKLREQGRTPYIIPLAPGHTPLGALGYIVAAREILEQCETSSFQFDHISVASGSGHTHGGLLFGLCALGSPVKVTGVCVRRDAKLQFERIKTRCAEIAELLQIKNPVKDDDIVTDDEFFAPGYGLISDMVRQAIDDVAYQEALLVDPVYTAKTMAEFLAHARESSKQEKHLMIHTGGTPALFAYQSEFTTD